MAAGSRAMTPGNQVAGIFAAPGTAGAEPVPRRIRWSRAAAVQLGAVLFAIALIWRAAQVQLVQRDEWRTRARAQQVATAALPAPRGEILDESGALLVESRQLVKLSVSPREVIGAGRQAVGGEQRMAGLTRSLARAGVASEWLARVRDTSRAWVELPGRFLATDVAAILAARGVHATPVFERVPPANDGLRRLVGRADDAGAPVDGLERSLDAVLRGTSGREALVRDVRGQRIRSPRIAAVAPTPGNTVVLSINRGLQDITEHALDEAVTTMRATGGDIVVVDPATGEIRAVASRRENRLSTGATALTEPYEPGSTLKPFVAARVLDLHRARVDEVVETYGGTWNYNGRRIEDDHRLPRASLADVIRYSSNIGIVQFAARLSHDEQYELLRDMGFGTPTGLPYPAESPGVLAPPRRWDALTPASLAMGYALNVTPIQLAMAYATIANGGLLLEPSLVKEVRTPDGEVTWRHERRVVRRVMSAESARELRAMLRGVVETGTAAGSNLTTFDVAGKTGTAQRTEHGRYVAGKYTASFVGMFPAENPQLVILVKLDNPTKSIYGGKAAAPVSKVVLQAALAARDGAIDRGALGTRSAGPRVAAASDAASRSATPAAGESTVESVVTTPASVGRIAAAAAGDDPGGETIPWVASVGAGEGTVRVVVAPRPVPDVAGLTAREAVRELHRAGFRAVLAPGVWGADRVAATAPRGGTPLAGGAAVAIERVP